MVGGGNNGKSVVLELITNVFGDDYGYKAPVSMLTAKREDAKDANSAYASMAGRRAIYYSEPGSDPRDLVLELGRVKEMMSPERQSTRGLYGDQGNFEMEAVHFVSTNNDFYIHENLYSAWKRVARMVFDVQFVPNPDPDDIPLLVVHHSSSEVPQVPP